jgi:hypothetical protein
MGADGSRLLGGPGGAMSAYSTDNSSFFISYYPQFFCDTARSTSPLFSVLEFFGVYANADYQPNLKQIGSEKIATSHLEPTSPKFTFSVRPNPASNNLIVEVGGVKDRNLSIGIYNILGQQVSVQAFKPSTDDASCTMSIGTLPAGNYLVRVNLDEVYFKEDMISVVK